MALEETMPECLSKPKHIANISTPGYGIVNENAWISSQTSTYSQYFASLAIVSEIKMPGFCPKPQPIANIFIPGYGIGSENARISSQTSTFIQYLHPWLWYWK